MKTLYHESAHLHTTGKATYIDDIPRFDRELQAHIIYSPVAHGRLKSFDLGEAQKHPSVVAVLSHKDIPGEKIIGAIMHDEPVLVQDEISYLGQAMFIVVAETREAAEEAGKLIKYEIEELEPVVTIEQSMQKGLQLAETRKIERGDLEKAFATAEHIMEGKFETGAQEHWYLETHAAIAVPGEDNDIKVYSSTQNPTEIQMQVAEVLGLPFNAVEVETRRLGGAFGGKEAQAGTYAVLASVAAYVTGRPVRLRLERQDDQLITGKRHPFLFRYKVAFDKNGKITAADIDINGNAGAFADLSMAILERAMLHAENAYYIPNIRILGRMWRTNTAPNTAFRGFGGPQGIANIENIVHRIAHYLKKDPAEVQKINFYTEENNITPYGQEVKNNHLHVMFDQIMESSEYHKRKKEIEEFNKTHRTRKRGIGLTPVKFGISFTSSFLNQAGALVNVYTDGTVLVNHGGIEMGQGLYTKIKAIVADEFGISPEKVRVNATNTSKVPNTSPTAASTGADMNGMAAKIAVTKIKVRIADALAEHFNSQDSSRTTRPDNLVFEDNMIYDRNNPERKISFAEAMNLMRIMRVSLSATGFYKTPGVYFDREKGQGTPFYYFAYGMAISEVETDLLTGKTKVLRTDILHDVGDSLNPALDKGQIEGAFMQGLGWVLLEDIKWDERGRMLNRSPDTYKIPTIAELPEVFNVNLLEGYPNPGTIRQSKAVGEPPFMLGISAWSAVKNTLAELGNFEKDPEISIPATHDRIVVAVKKLLE